MRIILYLVALQLFFGSCINLGSKIENPESTVIFMPPVAVEVATEKATAIVSQMTLDEKLDLIKGTNSFFIKGFEKHGWSDIYLSDASQGVHIRNGLKASNVDDYTLDKSIAFPNTLELAATWNPQLANCYAKSIGEECRVGGTGVLLGPGMNIYRQSQNGRNFEYLGEDPYLAGKMVEQYVVGLQSTGVIATLKHFLANSTEYRRRASNSVLDERTMHEIYMPAFKKGVDAGAMAVMTAYNQVNGEWPGQSEFVINHLLRGELGFKNLVMTDWRSVNDCKALVKSGQDLEMPGGESMGNLKKYIESGEVDIKDIDRMCSSIITVFVQMDFLNKPIKDTSFIENYPQHEQVALNTAREGIVLLRNNNNLLPIAEGSTKNILITGMYVTENIFGGGSGEVKGYNQVSIFDALKEVYPTITYQQQASDEAIKKADYVMVNVCTWDYESCDRHFAISKEQEDLVARVSCLNANSLVIVSSGGGIRMTDWNKVNAIVYNWYPGQIGNKALAEILTGKTNPSGKLPMTIEKEFKDSPAYGYIPDNTRFMCDTTGYLDIHMQKSALNRWGMDVKISDAPTKLYNVDYKEGVLVGYRWYDTKNIEPLFPFGFGLSYTNFTLTNTKLSSSVIGTDETLKVTVTLTNTGNNDGATVVQLYVGEKMPIVVRPVKELKAFKKVMLKAGESKLVDMYLEKDAFAFWSSESKQWEINKGIFEIMIGQSSREISSTTELRIK